MNIRIVQREDKYYIQKRILFVWFTLSPFGMSEFMKFDRIADAEAYVKGMLKQKPKQIIIKEY